jgi:hypothetical protein
MFWRAANIFKVTHYHSGSGSSVLI